MRRGECLKQKGGLRLRKVLERGRAARWLSRLSEGCAEIGDVRLDYVEAGDGPLIVLLPGCPKFWYGWRDLST